MIHKCSLYRSKCESKGTFYLDLVTYSPEFSADNCTSWMNEGYYTLFFARKKLNEEVVSLYEYFCSQTHRFEFQNFFMNYLSICALIFEFPKSVSYIFCFLI